MGKEVAQGVNQSDSMKGRLCNGEKINVISIINPDSEIGSYKSLEDVSSLAVLANDPSAALPKAFTICSDVMSVFSKIHNHLMFFQLQGSNEEPLLQALLIERDFYTIRVAKGKIPTVFPNNWVRSCMAIDTGSGMINWVVDGYFVE